MVSLNYSGSIKNNSIFVYNKSELIVLLLFMTYAFCVIFKKIYGFSDGIVDVVLSSILLAIFIANYKKTVLSLRILRKTFFYKVVFAFTIYFVLLSFRSYNTVSVIFIEYLSVFKWLVYFIAGFCLGPVINLGKSEFLFRKLFLAFTFFIFLYSCLYYNWSGMTHIDKLFGFYDNSFESLFSLRSVFSIYAFVVFIYSVNVSKVDRKVFLLMLLMSLLFVFMSGNRKVVLGLVFAFLFIRFNFKKTNPLSFLKYFLVISFLVFLTQTNVFKNSISEYANTNQPRIFTYLNSFNIARDYFPFGSGPATFASRGSMVNYSPIYRQYGMDERWGFRPDDSVHFYNDTYWAQIIGQYGVFGTFFVLMIYISLMGLVGANGFRLSLRIILLTLLLMSVATPIFQRVEVALFIFFSIGVFVCRQIQIASAPPEASSRTS